MATVGHRALEEVSHADTEPVGTKQLKVKWDCPRFGQRMTPTRRAAVKTVESRRAGVDALNGYETYGRKQ